MKETQIEGLKLKTSEDIHACLSEREGTMAQWKPQTKAKGRDSRVMGKDTWDVRGYVISGKSFPQDALCKKVFLRLDVFVESDLAIFRNISHHTQGNIV